MCAYVCVWGVTRRGARPAAQSASPGARHGVEYMYWDWRRKEECMYNHCVCLQRLRSSAQ